MSKKLSYRIDLSDFWNKMLSGEVSFLMGAELVAQRVHSHIFLLKNDNVDIIKYQIEDLTQLAIKFEELAKNIKNGQLNYSEGRDNFSNLMLLLDNWSKKEVQGKVRTEIILY